MKQPTVSEVFAGLALIKKPSGWQQLLVKPVSAIQHDSRKLATGDIFVAVPGFEADGHQFLPQAEAQGALLAVVEILRQDLDLPQVQVANSRVAQAEMAANFYGHPSRALQVCGITGSNGKTTTSLMYRQIIELGLGPCGLLGTVAYESGSSTVASKLTTPDSLDLQRYLQEMCRNGYHYVVMEISSIGLDQERPRGTGLDVATFINLGREHLDYHGSIENYLANKKKIFSLLKPAGLAVLNLDDQYVASLLEEITCPRLTYGRQPEAALRAENIDISSGFAHCDLVFDPGKLSAKTLAILADKLTLGPENLRVQSRPLTLKVPGFHSVYNALAAAASALALGVELVDCIRGLEAYRGVERRFELIYERDFRIFDDHFANSKNIEMTLGTLEKMDYKHLVICYAIRGKRGVTVNRENIAALNRFLPRLRLKKFIATTSQDVVGHYDEVQPEEIEVYQEEMAKNDLKAPLVATLEEAVALSLEALEPGDVLLLAGCQGMDAGARIALHKLAESYPDKKKEILLPLQDRVCGW